MTKAVVGCISVDVGASGATACELLNHRNSCERMADHHILFLHFLTLKKKMPRTVAAESPKKLSGSVVERLNVSGGLHLHLLGLHPLLPFSPMRLHSDYYYYYYCYRNRHGSFHCSIFFYPHLHSHTPVLLLRTLYFFLVDDEGVLLRRLFSPLPPPPPSCSPPPPAPPPRNDVGASAESIVVILLPARYEVGEKEGRCSKAMPPGTIRSSAESAKT